VKLRNDLESMHEFTSITLNNTLPYSKQLSLKPKSYEVDYSTPHISDHGLR
jgi:hypothetical protein